MDEEKFQRQRSGYAAAFSDPRVIEAIRAGPSRRIAVAFVEWSGPLSQKIVIDWTVVSDDNTAHQFRDDRIVEAPTLTQRSILGPVAIVFRSSLAPRAAMPKPRR